ncbi:MAG: flagellar biosynthesis anti-sigma factor FlgM, partial [Thiobacillus sp.]|nr:flagellar biosynthesis anti-sigma factor FlgM [Thiobacillus sp.]
MKIDKRITPPAASKVSSAKGKGAGKSSAPTAGASDSLTLTDSSTRIRSLESDLASVDITDIGK